MKILLNKHNHYMSLNFWAVLLSMILSVVLGFIWYGPLFGKKWMQLSGIAMPDTKPSMSMMIKPIILSLIGSLFVSSVLTFAIGFHNAFFSINGFAASLSFAAVLWLGFIVPVYLNFTGWEGKPWTLFFINAGYWLVFFLLSASLITVFIPSRTTVPPQKLVTGSALETFSGTITAVDTGCFADATCSVSVDGKKVVLVTGGRSMSPDAKVGKLLGVESIGDLEKNIGQHANVYATTTPDGNYTLYGNSNYYVEVVTVKK